MSKSPGSTRLGGGARDLPGRLKATVASHQLFLQAVDSVCPDAFHDLRRRANAIARGDKQKRVEALTEYLIQWNLIGEGNEGHWLSLTLQRFAEEYVANPKLVWAELESRRELLRPVRRANDFRAGYNFDQRQAYLRQVRSAFERPEAVGAAAVVHEVERLSAEGSAWDEHQRLRDLFPTVERLLGVKAPARWELPSEASTLDSDPLRPVEALPTVETRAEFLKRAREHWAAREALAIRWGLPASQIKTNPDHFGWLVNYQLLGRSFSEIARNVGRTLPPVKRAISDTARLLGLRLREPDRAGRPKRHPDDSLRRE